MSLFRRRQDRRDSKLGQGRPTTEHLQEDDPDLESYPLGLGDIDIWAMRDAGYLRASDIPLVREHFGVDPPQGADYEHEPSDDQRQAVIAFYEGIAAHLNEQAFHERTDWTPRQAWSLGRAAVARMWGAAPESVILPAPWQQVEHVAPSATSDAADSGESGTVHDDGYRSLMGVLIALTPAHVQQVQGGETRVNDIRGARSASDLPPRLLMGYRNDNSFVPTSDGFAIGYDLDGERVLDVGPDNVVHLGEPCEGWFSCE